MFGALLIAAQLAGSVDFSDRTEARVRAPGTTPGDASLDLETAPVLELRLASTRWRYALNYTPRLTLWDAAGGDKVQPTFLNAGSARVEWDSRVSRLWLSEEGSYGGLSLIGAAPELSSEGTLPYPQLIPSLQVIEFASSTTTLGSRLSLARWTVDTLAGYQGAGGADASARALLPFERGPFASVVASYSVARRDDVLTTVSASESAFTLGPEDVLMEGDLGYRHRWSRTTDTTFSVGVSEAWLRPTEAQPRAATTYPVASVIVERKPAPVGELGARLGLRVGPVVNRLIGYVDERVEASLAMRYEDFGLAGHLFGSASQSIPTDGLFATSQIAGELGAAYTTGAVVVLDIGTRAFWQRQDQPRGTFVQDVFYLGVTLRAPKAHM